jgi:type I restriction enzyme S subunit
MQGSRHSRVGYEQTEIGIPETWRAAKLEELAHLQAGGTPSRFKKEYWENGTIPWLSSGEVRYNIVKTSNEKITELGLSASAAKLFPKGTVLIAITGQGLTRGRSALLGIDCTTNQSIVGIIPNESLINNIYLWYYLQNQYWKLRSISQGSNQAGLNLELLNSYSVLAPPLPEQAKIASILSKVDELIQKTDQVIEQTQRLKKGLMQRLLTKGIGHTEFKNTSIGEIPYEWPLIRLGDVVKVQGGYSFKSTDYIEEGIKLIRITNVSLGHIDLKDLIKLPYSFLSEYKEFSLVENDIVIVLTRPVIEGGIKAAKIASSHVPALLNQRIGRFKILKNDKVFSDFLFYIIFSNRFIMYVKERLGVTHQPNISPSEIEKYLVSLPSKREQKDIAVTLSNTDYKISKLQEERSRLQDVKKGLMQKLLTGKIRVKL